ncbi:MAG TPA: cation-transporting P-type ATPase [Polyangiaceae bacterium]|nr:cation-transporting P-type ATPase [Polyangiaceae bacterium]
MVAAPVAEQRVQPCPVHTEAAEALVQRLETDPSAGLTEAEAGRRLAKDGPNELPKPVGKSTLTRLLEQFSNPIVLTLLAAAVIALVDGATRTGQPLLVRFGDATAILLIVAINAVLGFVQERRAEAALAALETMQVPNARVRRGDALQTVSSTLLVAGDILELEAGDAVPADARLLQTIGLFAEESALTGESVPVSKDARAAIADDAPLGDRANMLFVGSSVVRGKARAVVVATGPRSELGHLSALIHQKRHRTTPLEEKLDSFGKRVLWGCLALSGVLFARGMIRGDRKWHELLLEAVSLAVAAIPEGLPAITTITLALGMQRMAKSGAIIRKLAAVETLGAATVICTDKTGTLTQNAMTVREIYAGASRFTTTGSGYDPVGGVLNAAGVEVATPDRAPSGPLGSLLATISLCNSATLQHREGAWRVQGDPTEGALLTLAAKGGISHEEITSSHHVVKELPFDGDRKRMTIVALDEAGKEMAHSKGSADVLLPLCAEYDTDAGPRALDDDTRRTILDEADRMSKKALRVLAVARRDLGTRPASGAGLDAANEPEAEIETHLTFLGLVGMVDPPREGVREAVARCAEAHVRAVMITGDHKLTAMAIAQELGLWAQGPNERAIALTGSELEKMSDDELGRCIEDVRVFARVTADQKLRIVALFKKHGHVVAMTGDGVNDAPALREAHIGVAMGKNGTDVAREAADMVIADDNFATIVEAVREGRAIWRNIQKFIFFLLSSNAGLLVAVFTVAFFTELPPLTPLMILWINLVTNGLPALALGIDDPDPTQMREPPRRSKSGLLEGRDWLGMAAVGIWMGGTAMAAYLLPLRPGDVDGFGVHGRAIAFSLLALSPLFHAFNCRSATESIFAQRPLLPIALVGAVAVSAGIHLTAVVVPGLRPVFRTFPMDLSEWATLLLLSASIIPVVEVLKLGGRLFFAKPDDPAKAA